MPNMKTAISIEETIFQQMDSLAKKLRISRSRLFSIAAQEFLQRNNNMELLKSLNAAYDDLPETEPIISRMRSTHYNIVKDQW